MLCIFLVAACKARWNNIRDTYRKSLKKNTTKSGQSAAKKIKNYKFADQLSFINKYFEERKSKTNIEYENDEEEEENMQLDSEEQPEENLSSQPSLTSVQTNEIHVPIKTTKQKFSKTSVSQPTASARLMDYLISKKKEENQMSTGSHHPVDAFLSGIAPTLKTLSPYDLHLAKSEIFAIVQKYELQQILRRNSSTTSSMNSVTPLPSPSEDFNAHISPNQNISSASFITCKVTIKIINLISNTFV